MTLDISTINIGTVANDLTGDTVRSSFNKTNGNFSNTKTLVEAIDTRLGTVEGDYLVDADRAGLQSQIDSLAAGGAYPEISFATMLGLTPADGTCRMITDFSAPTLFRYSTTRTRWEVVGGKFTLARSNTSASVSSSTSETTLATITIPANLLLSDGIIEIGTLWSCTSSANNKTFRTRLGGAAGTILRAPVFTTIVDFQDKVMIRANNATNAQKAHTTAASAAYGSSGSAIATATRDMTASQDLVITGQCANGADTITLESYIVIIHR